MSYDLCDKVSPECPVEATIYGDYFTLGATATYASLFGLFMAVQAPLAYRAKTWSYGAWLFAGTAFEFVGYLCRSILSDNPWNFNAFIGQNLCLVLGPTMVAAAISVTFKHLVLWYGPEHSPIRPRLYPWVFVGTDLISIMVQGTGGGIASAADGDQDMSDLGNNLLLAGVAFQVVNMTFCGGLILVYVWRRIKAARAGPMQMRDEWDADARGDMPPCYRGRPDEVHRNGKRVRMFIWGLALAYIVIIIRCIYRIPEMAMGWGSSLMRNEATFMALDGAMLLIACGTLSIVHPCFFFPYMGKGHADKSKQSPEEHELTYGGQSSGSEHKHAGQAQ